MYKITDILKKGKDKKTMDNRPAWERIYFPQYDNSYDISHDNDSYNNIEPLSESGEGLGEWIKTNLKSL